MNDFLQVFLEQLNTRENLPYKAYIGFINEKSGIAVYPRPGGRTITGYMTGEKLISLPFEIAIKSKDQHEAVSLLWQISAFLQDESVSYTSQNHSFMFEQIKMSNEPFNAGLDEHKNFVYVLNFAAEMITNTGE